MTAAIEMHPATIGLPALHWVMPLAPMRCVHWAVNCAWPEVSLSTSQLNRHRKPRPHSASFRGPRAMAHPLTGVRVSVAHGVVAVRRVKRGQTSLSKPAAHRASCIP